MDIKSLTTVAEAAGFAMVPSIEVFADPISEPSAGPVATANAWGAREIKAAAPAKAQLPAIWTPARPATLAPSLRGFFALFHRGGAPA